MKKLILIILTVLGMGIAAQAQNANRSGAFIELSGGFIVGDSPITGMKYSTSYVGDSYVVQTTTEYLSGATFQPAVGYRWAFAKHWALEGKVGAFLPVEGISDFLVIEILPGLRYTSKEIGNSNRSFFAGFNAGYGYAVNEGPNHLLIYELKAGLNLTQRFSIGLVWNGFFNPEGYYYDYKYSANANHFGSLGINLGYRF